MVRVLIRYIFYCIIPSGSSLQAQAFALKYPAKGYFDLVNYHKERLGTDRLFQQRFGLITSHIKEEVKDLRERYNVNFSLV